MNFLEVVPIRGGLEPLVVATKPAGAERGGSAESGKHLWTALGNRERV